MKKLLIGAVSAVALAFAFSGPASADPNASQVCAAFDDFGYSHGECTSLIDTNGNSGPSDYCKTLKLIAPGFFDFFFKNTGDCVSQIRHL